MDTTRINLIFSVFGDNFSPEDFTNVIGIEATACWRSGEKIPGLTSAVRKENCWEYAQGFSNALCIDTTYNIFFEKFSDKIKLMSQFVHRHDLATKFDFIIEMIDEAMPSMFFDRNFLTTVDLLNAEIDIDLYDLRQ